MAADLRGSDRGPDGWYLAVELSEVESERVRVGQVVSWRGVNYRIAGVSRRVKPLSPGGAVVRLEIAVARTVE